MRLSNAPSSYILFFYGMHKDLNNTPSSRRRCHLTRTRSLLRKNSILNTDFTIRTHFIIHSENEDATHPLEAALTRAKTASNSEYLLAFKKERSTVWKPCMLQLDRLLRPYSLAARDTNTAERFSCTACTITCDIEVPGHLAPISTGYLPP